MDLLSWTPNYVAANEDHCKNYLADYSVWTQIPSINSCEVNHLKHDSLVRFRGMIQDMYNPEYYLEKYEMEHRQTRELFMKNGKYKDMADYTKDEVIIVNSDNNITSARQTYILISLPGTNSWVHDVEKESIPVTQLDECTNTSTTSNKRQLDDDMQMDLTTDNETERNTTNKRLCVNNEASTSQSFVSREHILNFPLSEENGKCCHLKVYEETDSLKLNEMIDVVGFLSLDPVLANPDYADNDGESEMEIQTHNPPPSLVPRIHCIAYRKVNDCNPLALNRTLSTEDILSLRKDLSLVLTQVLFGDELAADYLICHLISTVYLRKDLLTLGKFSVNISNIPANQHPNYGEELYDILQLLLTKSHYLPMSLDNMNSLTFVPKKDYECNRLTSGVLQLSSNTHLVLDETRLQPGKLNDSACRGLAAISDTIKLQRVMYDFDYYQMEYECDIPVLVLSEGKSLLPSDFLVPLVADDHHLETFPEIIQAVKHFLKPDLLNNLRVYLSKIRHSEYELSNSIMELVQNEFVQMRQNENITGEDLHQLLVLARLVCLSLGKATLDEECWRKACNMETTRKERLTCFRK